MFTIHSVLLIVHVLISASIIGLVLLQRGKGADAGAAFGSGASGTVFGARGSANFLSRTTAVLATAFFVTSLALAYLGSRQVSIESLMDADDTANPGISSLLPVTEEPAGAQGLPSLPVVDDPAAAETLPAPESGDETGQ